MSHAKETARYFAHFDSKLVRFRTVLEVYLKNPDVAAIHDVRTAFRRLEACYSILPSSVRTGSPDDMLRLGKQFFRLNSMIRDADIILEKLANQQLTDASGLRDKLLRTRTEALTDTLALARQLCQLAEPHFEKEKLQVQKQLGEKIKQRVHGMLSYLPLIQANEINVEELHAMRKQAKKLFYLLEMELDPLTNPEMKYLKKLQTLAGDIHDCDVTVACLKEHATLVNDAGVLISNEQTIRHNHYRDLTALLDEKKLRALGHLV